MIRKTIIIGLTLFVFLVATNFSVSAIDDEKTIPDPEGDVYDLEGIETDEKPNIDIVSFTYKKTDRSVTLDLQVKGAIEDRGDLNPEQGNEENLDAVIYALYLITSESEYEIMYANKECYCLLYGAEEEKDELPITYNVDGSILSLSFKLVDADENYVSSVVTSTDVKLLTMYIDELYDEGLITIAGEDYSGKPGAVIEFSGAAIGGIEPYNYIWDFGDGTKSDELSGTQDDDLYANHTYKKSGTYTATLTVTDSEGNTTYDTTTVIITGEEIKDSESGSGLLIFIALIAIIVVVVVVVVVYLIRR